MDVLNLTLYVWDMDMGHGLIYDPYKISLES